MTGGGALNGVTPAPHWGRVMQPGLGTGFGSNRALMCAPSSNKPRPGTSAGKGFTTPGKYLLSLGTTWYSNALLWQKNFWQIFIHSFILLL